MIRYSNKLRTVPLMRFFHVVLCLFMPLTGVVSAAPATGLTPAAAVRLPLPGTMLELSPRSQPMIIQGITLDPANPLQLEFIVHPGDEELSEGQFVEESERLIKYFLTALTVPEDQLWVNLSPYEKDRIISADFGETEMGRELLAQDYLLKQLSASMMYPEKKLGREFWHRVHSRAMEQFGTTDIPMNTFNKIWIVPEKAVVHRSGGTILVAESRMKVLLEEDYVALSHHSLKQQTPEQQEDVISGISADIVREVLIPEIEREVNHGQNFTRLRQIYHALILASWYKQHLQDSVLGQIYFDQNKTRGVQQPDPVDNQRIYQRYVDAFRKGVYNYIREDIDPATDQRIPRKYFSGGVDYAQLAVDTTELPASPVMIPPGGLRRVRVRLDGLGRNVAELKRIAWGNVDPDQSILAERIFDESELTTVRDLWQTLTSGEDLSVNDVRKRVAKALNEGADDRTQYFVNVGNWSQLLDNVHQILDRYDPTRPISYDSYTNMFELAMQSMLTGLPGIAEDKGALIVRVTEHVDDHFRFDAILLDRNGELFYDEKAERPIPIEQVLSSQTLQGPRAVYGELLPVGVLATDRFSVLSVRRNGSDTSEAHYWESSHHLKFQIEQGQARFNRPPVAEGTAIVLSTFMKRNMVLGSLERDRAASDAAMMVVNYSQGIFEIAQWLGSAYQKKAANEPLVIVLHGRYGAGKTFTKDIMVEALQEMGFDLDPTRTNTSRKIVHRYNAWRNEDKLDEAWSANFYGHTGIVIVETVEMPVPVEWKQAENLLFVYLRANESRRLKRIERKGPAFAGQLRSKAVHETKAELDSFGQSIFIENSDIDINKRFLNVLKFQYGFENHSTDVALLAKTEFHETASEVDIEEIVRGLKKGKVALRSSPLQIFRVEIIEGELREKPLSAAEFERIHQEEDRNPVIVAATRDDLDTYLRQRIPRRAMIRVTRNGDIFVDGFKQANFADNHDVVHLAFARMAAETPFERSYVLDAIVFESLFGKGRSPQDQLMLRAYEEMVVRKVENYFTNIAMGRSDAREKMDAQMDIVLSKVGWTQDHLNRLIQLVQELNDQMARDGYLEMEHEVYSQLTSRDIDVTEHAAVDAAVMASPSQTTDPLGGIDFNPGNMTIETRGDTTEFHFEFDPASLEDLNFDGFVPVILNVAPLTTLPLLSGTAETPRSLDEIPAMSPAQSFSDKISRR